MEIVKEINKELNLKGFEQELIDAFPNFLQYHGYGNKYTFKFDGDITESLLDNVITNHNHVQYQVTLAAKIARSYGIGNERDIDISIDKCEFFKPKEKVYNLKGEPVRKDYVYFDENDQEILICSIFYSKTFNDVTTGAFTSNEFVGGKATFRFYVTEDQTVFKDKVVESLPFQLVPSEVKDENDVVTGYVYSSVKREEVLRGERYKSEQLMKTFNPPLYNMFTQVFNTEYVFYKETGDKSQLVAALIACVIPSIRAELDRQVHDDDKKVIFGDIDPLPSLTVQEMIIGSLQ